MQRWLLLAGLLIAGTETASARDQIAPALDVRAFRFYRADGGETLVTGLIVILAVWLDMAGRRRT